MSNGFPGGFSRSQADEDEISIIDLWLILVRYKWLIVCVVACALVLVMTLMLSKKEQYGVMSTIELASINMLAAAGVGGGGIVPIEPSAVVLEKLNRAYIPLVLDARYVGDAGLSLKVEAVLPAAVNSASSQLVILESTGSVSAAIQRVIHEEIMALLLTDHERLIAPQRQRIEHQLKAQRFELAAMRQPLILANNRQAIIDRLVISEMALERMLTPLTIEAKIERGKQAIEAMEQSLAEQVRAEALLMKQRSHFEAERLLLEKEITDLEGQIKQALQRSVSVAVEAPDGTDGVALLLIDNVIQENRSRLARLEKRLVIAFPERELVMENDLIANQQARLQAKKKIDLMKKEFGLVEVEHERSLVTTKMPVERLKREVKLFEIRNARAIEGKLLQIDQLAATLDAVRSPRFVTPPMALNLASSRGLMNIVLAVIGGLILAIFLAFFMEFLSAVRRRKSEVEGGVETAVNGEGSQDVKLVSPVLSQVNG